jgi:hypothetical protein
MFSGSVMKFLSKKHDDDGGIYRINVDRPKIGHDGVISYAFQYVIHSRFRRYETFHLSDYR